MWDECTTILILRNTNFEPNLDLKVYSLRCRVHVLGCICSGSHVFEISIIKADSGMSKLCGIRFWYRLCKIREGLRDDRNG